MSYVTLIVAAVFSVSVLPSWAYGGGVYNKYNKISSSNRASFRPEFSLTLLKNNVMSSDFIILELRHKFSNNIIM